MTYPCRFVGGPLDGEIRTLHVLGREVHAGYGPTIHRYSILDFSPIDGDAVVTLDYAGIKS